MRPTFIITPESLRNQAKAINDHLKTMQNVTLKGLLLGARVILYDAQKRCPLKYGNLKASGDIVWQDHVPPSPNWKVPPPGETVQPAPGTEVPLTGAGLTTALDAGWKQFTQECQEAIKQGPGVSVCVGFGAYYAVFVHERLDAKHPIGEAKFLENAMIAKAEQVFRQVARAAQEATK